MMITIEEMRDDYDWTEAFGCASVDPANIESVIASDEGQNDGESWIALFKMKNGTFCFLTAWCDYTGWDCQSGGDAYDNEDFRALLLNSVPEADRKRLGYGIDGEKLDKEPTDG